MAFVEPDFKDITMKTQNMTCNIKMAKFNGRFRRAQIWLDRTLIEKMKPYIPYKTGDFQSRIVQANAGTWGTGEITTAVPPQGKYLYPGISPRTGKPFKWTNPQTQPRWGTFTYQTYKPDFIRGILHIIAKGSYPDGG